MWKTSLEFWKQKHVYEISANRSSCALPPRRSYQAVIGHQTRLASTSCCTCTSGRGGGINIYFIVDEKYIENEDSEKGGDGELWGYSMVEHQGRRAEGFQSVMFLWHGLECTGGGSRSLLNIILPLHNTLDIVLKHWRRE